jgi:hypothetical protein
MPLIGSDGDQRQARIDLLVKKLQELDKRHGKAAHQEAEQILRELEIVWAGFSWACPSSGLR